MKKHSKVTLRVMTEGEAYEAEKRFLLSADCSQHEATRARLNDAISQKTAVYSPRIEEGRRPDGRGETSMQFGLMKKASELWGYGR